MTDLQISVPESLLAALRCGDVDLTADLMRRFAQFAEMSRAEFLAELARRRVGVFVVEKEDLERELADA